MTYWPGANIPQQIDLTDPDQNELVFKIADFYLYEGHELATLKTIELGLIRDQEPAIHQLGVKLAISKKLIAGLPPVFISVVFALYKEQERMKKKTEHPHGEDFIRRKIEQLDWLTNETNARWELILVDDGCPENSGEFAREIIAKEHSSKPVSVLFLQDAIDSGHSIAEGLANTDDSRKGGSVQLGMWNAVQEKRPNHVVIFTDADLSTNLGQCGLLVKPIVQDGYKSTIGSRREVNSVVIKKGIRNDRGKLFIYLWKRMIPVLNYIIDTQCGFKAFDAETVRNILPGMIEKKFAFDIELLIKTELLGSNSIKNEGIAWIDSEAASTTTDIQPYLPMLKAIARMYDKYLSRNDFADAFREFILDMTEQQWQNLLNRIPEEITSREPAEFNNYDEVSVETLRSHL